MGDGADKILAQLEKRGATAAGFFASDGFVRGQTFHGQPVMTFAQAEERFSDFIIVLAFGTSRPEVLARVAQYGQKHELLAPDVPVYGGEIFDKAYYRRHRQALAEVYGRLADPLSKKVFEHVIAYKITGEPACLIQVETPRERAVRELLKPRRGDCFVDAGACKGDTVEEFLRLCGEGYGEITALEPDPKNFQKLCRWAAPFPRVRCLNAAAWDGEETLTLTGRAGRQTSLCRQGTGRPVRGAPIDRLDIRPPTLIKYDVEGAEARALAGSQKLIRAYGPRLNLALYHRSEDLFRLIPQVLSYYPDYRVYLRKHPGLPAWDVNAYFVPF